MSFDPISAGIDLLRTVIDKAIPDPNAAAAAKQQLENDDVKIMLAQIGVNAIEAQSTSRFDSGWRPALAWVCVVSFFYAGVIYPVIHSFLPEVQPMETTILGTMVSIIFGLAGLRTVDKINGVAK